MQALQTNGLGASLPPPFAAVRGVEQAGIVHDLGNHIQIVSSALNILSRELNGSSRIASVLAAARDSIDRATALVRQSLDGARARAANEPVSLARCLEDLLPTLRSISGPAITVALAAAANLPCVTCNRIELENVMLNMTLNARDAMPGGGMLHIVLDQVGADIVLRVADNGSGMSAEVRARALQPFFTTKSERGGSGVGLATVVRFAAAAGGRVELDSTVGVGTTITLSLPVGDEKRSS